MMLCKKTVLYEFNFELVDCSIYRTQISMYNQTKVLQAGKLLCPILIISIWVSEGLVNFELLFQKTLCSNLLHLLHLTSISGSVVAALLHFMHETGVQFPFGATIFQLSFFSISSFFGHQTFLFKTSNLRNHPSFRCSEGRITSHIKGLP